ncbi:MAG TPA: AMP-binding protein [Ramlibacter sp.]|nr:AMP-binding protein [Ramlibacter sp.]
MARDPASTQPALPLGALLARAVRERPATRLHFYTEAGASSATTQALLGTAWRLARGLRALGLKRGDAFAMQLPTSPETAALYLAALDIGAVLVPIVHIYGSAEVGFILRDSKARFLAVPDQWRGIDFLERLQAVGPLPTLERTIVVGERALPGAITYRALQALGAQAPAQPPAPAPDPDDICLLLYTSGTTASPKGVRHSHRTVAAEWLIPFIDGRGPYFTPFPAGHIAGFNFLLRPFVSGTDMVYQDRWDAPLAAELFERHRVRLSGGTPFHLLGLLDAARQAGRDLSSLASYGLGGTGVTPEHVELADRAGFAGTRAYGLTEHSTVSVGWKDMPLAQRAHTDGRLQPGSEVRIVGEDGNALPIGSEGEILVRGPELFVGYTDPALDAQAFTPDGWLRTGDIGRLDAAGCLTITDRKKDIVIRGGENISSQEVERVLATHPAVREAAVVAMPDARYGETVCAFVVTHTSHALPLAEVQRHFSAAGVARQKTPEALFVVGELPRTASGKVRKAELRNRLAAQAS